MNVNFYNSIENYPTEVVTATEPLIMRDLVLINLSVTPFSYNPSTNNLEVFTSLDIRLIETDVHKNPDELIQVAERVARIKKITVEQVIEQCDQNANKLFNLS